MLESDPHRTGSTQRALFVDPLQAAFLGVAGGVAVALGTALGVIFGMTAASLLSLAIFVTLVAVATYFLPGSHPHGALGTANGVTLWRGGMAAFVAAAIFDPSTAVWTVFAVAVVAFALDGLDGFLARREGLTSAFGARFDMEVDAALGAILSLVLLSSGKVGAEILILGFMRYGFVAASIVWPWLNGPLPESMRRKTVCVIQIAALIFLLFPWAPGAWLMPVSLCAALALSWSFAVDIRWLKRVAD